MRANVLLGTQGWNDAAWVGPFYPLGTRQADMLRVYAKAFSTVEVDSSFYGPPPGSILRGWRECVPEGFLFSLKVPQQITHEKRLRDVEELTGRFCKRVAALGPALGALLVQLSPAFRPSPENRDRVQTFCATLPSEFRWAIEFRHRDWLDDATLDLLRRHNVALVLADSRWIKPGIMMALAVEPTADFAYVRWMGWYRRLTDHSRVQLGRATELSLWARALEGLAPRVNTVFGYFNNHYQGHGPESVRLMQRMLGQSAVEPAVLQEQVEL